MSFSEQKVKDTSIEHELERLKAVILEKDKLIKKNELEKNALKLAVQSFGDNDTDLSKSLSALKLIEDILCIDIGDGKKLRFVSDIICNVWHDESSEMLAYIKKETKYSNFTMESMYYVIRDNYAIRNVVIGGYYGFCRLCARKSKYWKGCKDKSCGNYHLKLMIKLQEQWMYVVMRKKPEQGSLMNVYQCSELLKEIYNKTVWRHIEMLK